jgi:hypothetical protein
VADGRGVALGVDAVGGKGVSEGAKVLVAHWVAVGVNVAAAGVGETGCWVAMRTTGTGSSDP